MITWYSRKQFKDKSNTHYFQKLNQIYNDCSLNRKFSWGDINKTTQHGLWLLCEEVAAAQRASPCSLQISLDTAQVSGCKGRMEMWGHCMHRSCLLCLGGSEADEEQVMVGLLHGKQAIVILSDMPVFSVRWGLYGKHCDNVLALLHGALQIIP